MRARARPLIPCSVAGPASTDGGGEWLGLLVSLESLLGAALLLTLLGVFALGVVPGQPGRVARSRRADAGGRRRPEVVVLDLEGFTDAELAQLLQLRRQYHPHWTASPRRGSRRPLR